MTEPRDSYSPERRTALLFTGTGADGAYHAGALRALQEAGVKIDIVGGRGIGALAAVLAAVDGGAQLWEPAASGAAARWPTLYRWRWPFRVLRLARRSALVVVLAVPAAVILLGPGRLSGRAACSAWRASMPARRFVQSFLGRSAAAFCAGRAADLDSAAATALLSRRRVLRARRRRLAGVVARAAASAQRPAAARGRCSARRSMPAWRSTTRPKRLWRLLKGGAAHQDAGAAGPEPALRGAAGREPRPAGLPRAAARRPRPRRAPRPGVRPGARAVSQDAVPAAGRRVVAPRRGARPVERHAGVHRRRAGGGAEPARASATAARPVCARLVLARRNASAHRPAGHASAGCSKRRRPPARSRCRDRRAAPEPPGPHELRPPRLDGLGRVGEQLASAEAAALRRRGPPPAPPLPGRVPDSPGAQPDPRRSI